MNITVVILGAGKGTRMKSKKTKILHEIGGIPIYLHALNSAEGLVPSKTLFVTSRDNQALLESLQHFDVKADVVIQDEQLGTGDAVAVALQSLPELTGIVVVLYGDTPFVKTSTLTKLVRSVKQDVPFAFLGFETLHPGNYGRIKLDTEGYIQKITEAKDCNHVDSSLSLCNSGIFCSQVDVLTKLLPQISNENTSGEYYLTDIAHLASEQGIKTRLVQCDEHETLGINTRNDLAVAEHVFQSQMRNRFMSEGVTLIDPNSVYFSFDTKIAPDVVIEPNVKIGKEVSIDTGAVIHSFSYLEGCTISEGAQIGPFARIRSSSEISKDAKVGNFVEVKASKLGARTKVSHLSYVGDASVGEETNIGAGTVFCNYDGVSKNKTVVGSQTFIGSNTLLIAPVEIGNEAFTAAGSVINQNVPDHSLGIARKRQKNLLNKAPNHKFRKG